MRAATDVALLTLPDGCEAGQETPDKATHPSAKASTEALAKAPRDPVADLIGVPLRMQFLFPR